MINWSFLDYFIAAAKEENFSKAANSLFYSQSYLSKKIATLEEDLGVALFERHGKKVVLTEAGEHLYEKASQINQQIAELQQDMKRFRPDSDSIQKVTYIYADPYANGMVTEILQQCRILHPEYHYEMVPATIVSTCDFADVWCYYSKDEDNCSEATLYIDQEKIYINKNSPVAHKNRLTLRDLAGHTCIVIRTVPRHLEWEQQIASDHPDITFHHVDDVFEAMSALCYQQNAFEIWSSFAHDAMPLYNTIGIPMDILPSMEFHIELTNPKSEAAKVFLQVEKYFCHNIS